LKYTNVIFGYDKNWWKEFLKLEKLCKHYFEGSGNIFEHIESLVCHIYEIEKENLMINNTNEAVIIEIYNLLHEN
jgi:hypothetical protein